MKRKVVIIGHGFTSRLAVIRSLASLDCEISVIVMTWYGHFGKRLDTTKPVDCYSRYVSHVYYCYAKDDEGIINILLSKCTDPSHKVVIIPDNDVSAALIDNNQARLSKYFLFPHINYLQGEVEKWMDKVRQKELAKKIGLNVPSSCVIAVDNHKYNLPETLSYPCFTKPLETLRGGKKFLRKCDNESELRALLKWAGANDNVRLLVEDYKHIDIEYALLGFSNGKDVVIPGIIQILSMAHGSHFGVACQGRVAPTSGFEEIIIKFKEFVRQIGFVGIFDIDFYESGGILYFDELNLRVGGSCCAITKMGVNLPEMLVRFLYGESFSDMNMAITETATFVNERMCLDDWYSGFISLDEYRSIIYNSDISFVKDRDDPKPYKAYLRYCQRMRVKLILKKICGKI